MRKLILLFVFALACTRPLWASSVGTEGASFLDIPVGAGPAALGSAYSALADDAYAPVWNPGGLGFLDGTQLAAQELVYLQSITYEYGSVAIPLPKSRDCGGAFYCGEKSLGASIQYLGSGQIAGTTDNDMPTGNFSSHYAAYNLSYGQAFLNDKLGLGVTGKLINAALQDVSANAYAADFGSFYRPSDNLTLAATLMNVGTKLTFINEGDPLPLAFHIGGAYQANADWKLVLEGEYPKTGLASAHMGVEWTPLSMIAVRAGYRTDTLNGLSAVAGLSTGLGLKVWGQELDYAWVPYGDLGDTNYISLVMHFGSGQTEAKRNLIEYQNIKTHKSVNAGDQTITQPDYQELMELMSETEDKSAQATTQGAAHGE